MKILLVDDHALVRQGLKQVLQLLQRGQETLCLEAGNGDEAMHLARLHPELDLILMDFDLPGKNGLTLLSELGQHFPQVPVMMLSGMPNPSLVQLAIQKGASGFLTKSGNSSELLHAIRHVLAGNLYVPSEFSRGDALEVRSTGAAPVLTARQQAVLGLLVKGLSNRQIGEQLHLSEETIKSHVSTILREFGVKSRVEAVSKARLWGYVV